MSNNVITLNKEYYRAKDLVNIFGIARSTVDKWSKNGLLTRKRIGKAIFYSKSDVDAIREKLG